MLIVCVVCAFVQTTSANDFFVGPQRASHDNGGGLIGFEGLEVQTDAWFSDTAVDWNRPKGNVGLGGETWNVSANYAVDALGTQPLGEPWIDDEQSEESDMPYACCEPQHRNTGFLDFRHRSQNSVSAAVAGDSVGAALPVDVIFAVAAQRDVLAGIAEETVVIAEQKGLHRPGESRR